MNTEIRELFLRMVGGNEERFFREHWRQRTLLVESALPQLVDSYNCSEFVQDYRRVNFHDATLIISTDRQGNRRMVKPTQEYSVDIALAQGMSVVLQTLLLPDNLVNKPAPWSRFITLYHDLWDYLLPSVPARVQFGGPVAALDVFCTFYETSSGGHYDTGDVFYFVLDGEKEWTVELATDMDMGIRLASERRNADLAPCNDYMKIRVKPGDCLYVPPYTYHRVCSQGKSLAVSLGLPTFNELTLIRSSAIRMQIEGKNYRPFPSFPRTQREMFRAAEEEVQERTLHALGLQKTRPSD